MKKQVNLNLTFLGGRSVSKKKRKDTSLRISKEHAVIKDDISQEQLRIILNNELAGIVTKAGLDVPVAPMKPVEIPRQDISTPVNKQVITPTTRVYRHKHKWTIKGKKARISTLIILVLLSIFALQNSTAYAVNNPVERARIGDDTSTVTNRLGTPDYSNDDTGYLYYYNVDFMNLSGSLSVILDYSNKEVTACTWTYTAESTLAAYNIFEAVYNNLSQIYGELGSESAESFSWKTDDYVISIKVSGKTITIDEY